MTKRRIKNYSLYLSPYTKNNEFIIRQCRGRSYQRGAYAGLRMVRL
jgi:hypothetical protein